MSDLNQIDRALTSVLEDAWDVFWKDVLLYVIAALVYGALVVVSLGLLSGALTVGFALLVQKRRVGEEAGVLTLLDGFRFFISATLAMMVIGLGVTLGLLLLIVPGLLLLAAWSFTFYAMASENLGVGEALSRSYGIFKDNALFVVVLLLVLGLINAVSSAFVVTELISIPYCMVALQVAYERLATPSGVTPPAHQMSPHAVR